MAIASKILITGAEGFTGRYLTQVMRDAGHEVYGTTQNNLDLRDKAAVRDLIHTIKPDSVAHLAAISSVTEHDIARIYKTNVLGTLYLLEALAELEKKPSAILLASSANIYGNSDNEIINEKQHPNPVNDYAVSKAAMEQMAQLWMNRLPIFIVRPFNYTGVGQSDKFIIPKIIAHFKNKKPVIELGNLDIWREFNDVRFVVNTYKQLLDLSPAKKIMNICSGQSYSLREIIALCEEMTGYSIHIEVNPQFVRANEIKKLQGDDTLLKQLIGNPHTYSMQETLSWMLHHTGEV